MGIFLFLLMICNCFAAPNVIGVYSDSLGTTACVDTRGLIKCYVVVSELSDPIGVGGWQFQLEASAGVSLLNESYPVSVLNMEIFPRLLVGCTEPILTDETIVLFDFHVWTKRPGSIFLRELDEQTPVAFFGAFHGDIVQFQYDFGGPSDPVFSFGGAPCPFPNQEIGFVPVQSMSWSRVKSQFR